MVSQGWKYFGGHFYYFSKISKTWYSAQQICISRDSHLTSVTSEREQVSALPWALGRGYIGSCIRQDGQYDASVTNIPKYQ